jgi:myo-inositol-1(or 4)-monophosphatase
MSTKRFKFALSLASKASEIIMRRREEAHALEWGLRTNFRTETDVELDALIRSEITENFPDDSIYSEEDSDKMGKSGYSWVVDPIDGTIPWFSGINNHFSVCIGLAYEGAVVAGVVNAPGRNEVYSAEDGKSFMNGESICVSDLENINQALVGVDPGKENRDAVAEYSNALEGPDGVTSILRHGCASVPLVFVASGRMHAYLATGLEPWDMAAAVAIIRGAGGVVTNLQGDEWGLEDSSILASNPVLHKKLMLFFEEHGIK